MDQFRLRTATLVVAATLIGLGVGLATGLLGGSNNETTAPATTATETAATGPDASEGQDPGDAADEPELPRTEDDPEGLEPGPSGPAPSSSDEMAAAEAAREYVEAIDKRNGREVCGAFAEGAIEAIRLPIESGSCAASVEASLGFSDARGRPVWDHSEMTQDVSAQVDGDSARVVATVFTKYADVREPTIEDDIIYLGRLDKRWLVLKPSATLYRAIGTADVPLDALKPPD
jgi:hypothetical protein